MKVVKNYFLQVLWAKNFMKKFFEIFKVILSPNNWCQGTDKMKSSGPFYEMSIILVPEPGKDSTKERKATYAC